MTKRKHHILYVMIFILFPIDTPEKRFYFEIVLFSINIEKRLYLTLCLLACSFNISLGKVLSRPSNNDSYFNED
jgi:hypothetical protein